MDLKIGDIVRKKGGSHPMVVRAIGRHRPSGMIVKIGVAYCKDVKALVHDTPMELTTPDRIVKITSMNELVPDWRWRMTDPHIEQLERQCPPSDHPSITTEGNIIMAKLYQTKEETPRFGTLLATNSAGLYVMEMKGTGEVLTFAKADVEEVKPYTVRIKFQDSTTEYDYLSRKGDVEKGDMVIVDGSGSFAKVVAVDTKSDRATKELVGRKVVTAPFGEALTE